MLNSRNLPISCIVKNIRKDFVEITFCHFDSWNAGGTATFNVRKTLAITVSTLIARALVNRFWKKNSIIGQGRYSIETNTFKRYEIKTDECTTFWLHHYELLPLLDALKKWRTTVE